MKPINKIIIILSILLSMACKTSALEVDGIKYTFISMEELTLEACGVVDENITEIKLPDTIEYNGKTLTVKSVGDEAFKDLTKLEKIDLPSSIESIGNSAFENDKSLVEVFLPNNLLKIYGGAFSNCTALKSICIPDSVSTIYGGTFKGCFSLHEVVLHENIQEIGAEAFYYSGIEFLEIPTSVKRIGEQAFLQSDLKAVVIPKEVEEIGKYCFGSCKKLTSVEFNGEKIPEGCFSGCSSLKTVLLSENCVEIKACAFYSCESLEEFVIPNGVEKISFMGSPNGGFIYNCPNIKKLVIGTGLGNFISGYQYGTPYDHTYLWDISYITFQKPPKYSRVQTTELLGLRELVINDAESTFDAGSFKINGDFDYFYAGRPLKKGTGNPVEKGTLGAGEIKVLELSGYCNSVPKFYQKVNTLILGPNIQTFNTENIYMSQLHKIVCESVYPPQIIASDIEKAFPERVYLDVVLYVPVGSKDAYAKADGWKYFWNIEEYADVPVESIELNKSDVSLSEGESIQLKATMFPDEASEKLITWYSSDESIVTVTDTGLITGVAEGSAVVTATCGRISAKCNVDIIEKSGLVELDMISNEKLRVYNLQGVLIRESCFSADLFTLPSGIYIVKSVHGQYKIRI